MSCLLENCSFSFQIWSLFVKLAIDITKLYARICTFTIFDV